MLKVVGLLPVDCTILEVDEYVPIQFRCIDHTDDLPLYWRTGDFNHQLLELGLNSHSGAICKVTLTGFGSWITGADEKHEVIEGVPVCDKSMWSNRSGSDYNIRFSDEVCPFQARFGTSQIRIDLSPEAVVDKWFAAGRAEFGIDHRNILVSLNFTQINSDEIKTI